MVIFMYCIKCGAKSSEEFNYCSNCGAKLIKELDVIESSVITEEKWNDIDYSSDRYIPFQDEKQKQSDYANFVRECNNSPLQPVDFKFHKLSIAGFVLACCAFIASEAGIFCAILGFIFSLIGLTSKDKIKKRGKGFAIAGVALSSAYLLFIIFCLLILLVICVGRYF